MPAYPEADASSLHYAPPSGWQRVLMAPAAFLGRVPPLTIDEESEETITDLQWRIEGGLPLDALQIGKGRHHDGRHRAHAAMRAGVALVPVYLDTSDN